MSTSAARCPAVLLQDDYRDKIIGPTTADVWYFDTGREAAAHESTRH